MSSQCAALHRPPLAPPSAVRRPPSRLHAVVAARGGPEAKSRCSGVLSPELRAGLAAAMLEDVLSALIRARTISAIWVVTPTPQLAELALRMGARCLRQPQPIDVNSTVAGTAQLASSRADRSATVLVVMARSLQKIRLKPSEIERPFLI